MSLLNVSGLSFRYPSTIELFRYATFAVEADDCLAIVGVNGAGKSTLLRILAGELEPASGTLARRKGLRLAYVDQQGSAGAGTLFDPSSERVRNWPGCGRSWPPPCAMRLVTTPN